MISLQMGDIIQLNDGSLKTIFKNKLNDRHAITLNEANILLEKGEIVAITAFIEGDEVLMSLPEYEAFLNE